MTKMFTLQDARNQKNRINDEFYARIQAREDRAAEISTILRNHPEIGVLNSGKFYTFPAGGEYREANHPSELI